MNTSRVWVLGLLAAVGAVYFVCLPHTVQELDTGEMVANAWTLTVAHPPGAPLYILMQHLVTHLVGIDTVFWRAALFNACCALAALAALAGLKRAWLPALAIVLPLGLSPVYWSYAVRPDVFGLHACITALMGVVYLRDNASQRRAMTLAALAAVGACVQQTIVFAAPLLVHALWETRRWRAWLHAGFLGAAVVLLGYSSLLAMHPAAMESWGHLQSAGDVVRHMLRTDYGTFQLDGHGQAAPWGDNLALLASTTVQSMPVALGLALALVVARLWRRRAVPTRDWVLVGTMAFYVIVFFGLANNPNPAILHRFFMFPLVLLALAACRAWEILALPIRWQRLLAASALVVTFSQMPQAFVMNDLSKDTVIEDYAINLLHMAEPHNGHQAALVVDGDTRGYALRYAQSVLHVRPDVLVLNMGNLFGGQFRKKLQLMHPDFQYGAGWDRTGQPRPLGPLVMQPNQDRYDFYFTRDVTLPGYHATYLGLGRRLSPGAGEDTDLASVERLLRRSAPAMLPSPAYDERKDLYSEYAYVFLKDAQLSHDPNRAIADYAAASDTVPYCFVALQGLCKLRSPTPKECMAWVHQLRADEYDYYRRGS